MRQIKLLEGRLGDTGWEMTTQREFQKFLLDISKVLSSAISLQLEIKRVNQEQEKSGRDLSLDVEGLMTRVGYFKKLLEDEQSI